MGAVKEILGVSVELYQLSPRDCVIQDGIEHTQAASGTGGDISLGAPHVLRHKVLMADYERELYSVTHEHQQQYEQQQLEARRQKARRTLQYRLGFILTCCFFACGAWSLLRPIECT